MARARAVGLGLLAAVVVVTAAVLLPAGTPLHVHLLQPVLAGCLVWLLAPVVASGLRRLSPPPWLVAPRAAWVVGAAVTVLVFVQSWRLHAWFGSSGRDLGSFHQSVWLLSRFAAPDNTLLGMHAFADHLELVDLLVVPLVWIWDGAEALLLFQAACIGLGAATLFDMARRRLGSAAVALCVALAYVCAVDMQNAVMFDWNPTTCGAGLLPAVAWSFERRRPWLFVVALVLVALCKENLVLYAGAWCLALALEVPAERRRALAAAAILAGVFVIEMQLVFPLFRPEGFRHLRYEALGGSAFEIAGSVLTSPLAAVGLLFTPAAKLDGLLAPLSSFAFALCLAPRWGLALLPIVLERFWSTHEQRWWGYHYGAGAAAVGAVAAIAGLERLAEWRPAWLGRAAATVLASSLLVAFTVRGGSPPFLSLRHPYHTSERGRLEAEALVARVPPGEVSVAAQSHLLPHLSARHEIYELGRPVRAEYVALHFEQGTWPYDAAYVSALAHELVLSQRYGVVFCEGRAVLLQRGAVSLPCPAMSSGDVGAAFDPRASGGVASPP